jgi:hypothetical protein
LLEAYSVNQRVGMTMNLPPLGSFTTKDQGHAQRPVLVRQTAHLAVLSFDHRHDHQVAGGVCLHDFQIRIACLKLSRGDLYGLVGIVAAADQFSARRRHQGVVLGWLDERKVSANIATHIGRGRFCCALNERGKVLVGDALVRHVVLFLN